MSFASVLDYSGVFEHRLFFDYACVFFSGLTLPLRYGHRRFNYGLGLTKQLCYLQNQDE